MFGAYFLVGVWDRVMDLDYDLVIVVEGEPVAKQRPKFGRGRTYTPAKTVAYERVIQHCAKVAMKGQPWLEGPLAVRITSYRSIPKTLPKYKREAALKGHLVPTTTPDTDNYAKAALDGLNQIVFKDDAQVCDLIALKRYSNSPRLVIEVRKITEMFGVK